MPQLVIGGSSGAGERRQAAGPLSGIGHRGYHAHV